MTSPTATQLHLTTPHHLLRAGKLHTLGFVEILYAKFTHIVNASNDSSLSWPESTWRHAPADAYYYARQYGASMLMSSNSVKDEEGFADVT